MHKELSIQSLLKNLINKVKNKASVPTLYISAHGGMYANPDDIIQSKKAQKQLQALTKITENLKIKINEPYKQKDYKEIIKTLNSTDRETNKIKDEWINLIFQKHLHEHQEMKKKPPEFEVNYPYIYPNKASEQADK